MFVNQWYESSAGLLVKKSKMELVGGFCDVFCDCDEQFVREIEKSSHCCGMCTDTDTSLLVESTT